MTTKFDSVKFTDVTSIDREPKRISATALDVQEGDIVFCCGYRCRATDVSIFSGDEYQYGNAANNGPVARYTLNSAPIDGGKSLPRGYEGMRSGGNKFAGVTIER